MKNITTITLGGIEYKAKLGTRFLQNLCEGEKITLDELFNKFASTRDNPAEFIFLIPKIIYYAVALYNELDGDNEELKLIEVYDALDEEGFDSPSVVKFLEEFSKSCEVYLGKQKPPKGGRKNPTK